MVVSGVDDCRKVLADRLKDEAAICFFTGAGISTESGIPDFRSPGGIWSKYRIIEYSEFLVSETARLEDWERRFHMADCFESAEPNPAHVFVADMIRNGRANGVITQNIDGLHQRAGMPGNQIVEFHGTGTYAHCLSCGSHFEITAMRRHFEENEKSPRCTCGGYVKAAVISFGESVPDHLVQRSIDMIDEAEIVVVIGSSLQVWPVVGLLERAKSHDATLCIINRDPTPFDEKADLILRGSAAEITDNLGVFLV